MTNLAHIIETAILLLVAYQLGWFVGFVLRRMMSRPAQPVVPAERIAAVTGEPSSEAPVRAPVIEPVRSPPIPPMLTPEIGAAEFSSTLPPSEAQPAPKVNLDVLAAQVEAPEEPPPPLSADFLAELQNAMMSDEPPDPEAAPSDNASAAVAAALEAALDLPASSEDDFMLADVPDATALDVSPPKVGDGTADLFSPAPAIASAPPEPAPPPSPRPPKGPRIKPLLRRPATRPAEPLQTQAFVEPVPLVPAAGEAPPGGPPTASEAAPAEEPRAAEAGAPLRIAAERIEAAPVPTVEAPSEPPPPPPPPPPRPAAVPATRPGEVWSGRPMPQVKVVEPVAAVASRPAPSPSEPPAAVKPAASTEPEIAPRYRHPLGERAAKPAPVPPKPAQARPAPVPQPPVAPAVHADDDLIEASDEDAEAAAMRAIEGGWQRRPTRTPPKG
jgi:hypothetical protein